MRQHEMEAAEDFHRHEMNVGPDGWERWITKLEHAIGHDLDGSNDVEGYSYDTLIEWYDGGVTLAVATAAVSQIIRDRKGVR